MDYCEMYDHARHPHPSSQTASSKCPASEQLAKRHYSAPLFTTCIRLFTAKVHLARLPNKANYTSGFKPDRPLILTL